MLNSAVLFLHSSGLSDNHSIHQKYNTYIVRQSEIFHKSCSWSVCFDCLLCKSTFLLAYKNCFPGKTLPSPLHVRIFLLLTGSQNFSICFINIGNRYQKTAGENVLCVFNPDLNCFCSYYRPGRTYPLIEIKILAALFSQY